jgi:DNA-binding NarL/FixJ family response regulator
MAKAKRKSVNHTPRILIVDDNQFMRWAIKELITRQRPDWLVCGEAANGEEAVSAASTLKPDIVIMDESMPIMSGLEAASRMSKMGLKSQIIMLTAFDPKDISVAAESLGAPVYPCVDKARSGHELVPALDALVGGTAA